MLAADTVLLMDGGNNRPGCKFPTGQNCFSRATKYRLDAATGAATLEWQFAYSFANNSLGDTTAAVVAAEPDVKDVFVADGGSVAYLVDADAYLVGFTMTPSDGRYSKFAYFFQVGWGARAATDAAAANPAATLARNDAFGSRRARCRRLAARRLPPSVVGRCPRLVDRG